LEKERERRVAKGERENVRVSELDMSTAIQVILIQNNRKV
jgi:hypothetical protein